MCKCCCNTSYTWTAQPVAPSQTDYEQGYLQGLTDALECAKNEPFSQYSMKANIVDSMTKKLTTFVKKFKRDEVRGK